MPPYAYVPGAARPNPLLAAYALNAAEVPENFVQPLLFPDSRVESFTFDAPTYGDEGLEAVDDDPAGSGTDFRETLISEGSYSVEIGAHGRKCSITQDDLQRAEIAKRLANGANDPVFNLKARRTTIMLEQNNRHNELLCALLMTDEDNYSETHVFDALPARTSASVREIIASASAVIEDDSGKPANAVVVGVGSRRSLEANTNFLSLLPENQIKVIDRETLRRLLSLPDNAPVLFPTARVKAKKGSATYPIWNNFIWVGRVIPDVDGVNATFGRNFWMPDHRNGQRVYVNEISLGVAENIEIGLKNYYRPVITGAKYGVLIPTTDT